MKLKTLMIITAVLAATFGLAFLLVPGQVLSLYGMKETASLIYIGQLFGVDLVTFAILAWLAKNAAESEARKAIVLALFIGFAIGFVFALLGQLKNVVNVLGWFTVVSYLLLAIGFGYFNFRKSAS
jgi:hypothetical protein